MKINGSLAAASLTVLLFNASPCRTQTGSQRSGSYYSGRYVNLFVQLLGKNESETRGKIDTAFNRLFFGGDESQRVCYPAGDDMGYVEDIANGDVRTEGMSYGMMIAVQMDRKDVFDRIWKWAKSNMQVQAGPHSGYFAWHCKTDGTVLDSTAASDGEQWFVMSLLFASARWGNGNGIYDYRTEAQEILNTMLHKEDEPDHGNVTDMFDAKSKLVSFVPAAQASWFTDPSYQLPHFYELWARWTNNQFWCDAAKASRDLLQQAADPKTGLSPDYSNFDGGPLDRWGRGHDDFRFDAWRVAMNIAMDHEWFDKDPREVEEANRLLNFFYSQGIDAYVNQYSLNGKPLSHDRSLGLVAMNAVAAVASTNRNRQEFVEKLWNSPVPSGFYRYYDGMLYMLAMLQVSGNFRIYDPTGKPVEACTK
ncbi:MAG TPA: glycosyl hydrolase family 8 [Candidatus Kryptonia bacterium]